MLINSLSSSVIATAVWNQATRQLTKGITAGAVVAHAQASLANLATLDLRPAAGVLRLLYIATSVSASTTGASLYDGTNFMITNYGVDMFGNLLAGTSVCGPAIQNNNGGAINYEYGGADLTLG